MTTWTLFAALLSATPAAAPAAPAVPPAQAVKAPAPAIMLRAPLYGGVFDETPVAAVDGEAIYLSELASILEQSHAEMPGAVAVKKQDVSKLVDRLVGLRIIAAESKVMGLHELKDVAKQLADQRAMTARAIVKERATAEVKSDPQQVEEIFKSKVREVRIDSVLFKAPDDAAAFHKAVTAGGDWKKLADEAIAAGKAASGALPEFVLPEKLLPVVRSVIEELKPGEVAKTPIATAQGVAVVRYLDERFPENAESRAQAEELSRGARVQVELIAYYERLAKKHAKIDWKLFKALDLDSAKKFEARRKDKRALVTIQGAEPLLVSDLVTELERTFFHGVARRADKKELNAKKEFFFNEMLFKRLLNREAELQGVFESAAFRTRYGDFERQLLFQKFIERVLLPGVEVTEAEAKAKYEANTAAFSTPPMVRLEAIAFDDAKAARAALEKGQRGAEFRWLLENTEHQVAADARNLDINPKPVVVSRMPPGLARSLEGAREGDYRLHVEGDQHWVLHVWGEIAPSVRPFEEVKKEVTNVIYGEKMDAALREYVEKLRAAHQVEVYVTGMAS